VRREDIRGLNLVKRSRETASWCILRSVSWATERIINVTALVNHPGASGAARHQVQIEGVACLRVSCQPFVYLLRTSRYPGIEAHFPGYASVTNMTTTTIEAAGTSTLPDGFLSTPSPDLKVTRIDFSRTEIPEYKNFYAVVLDNVLTHDECRTLLQAAEATVPEQGWERAMVNIGMGQQAMYTDVRNCGRIIWDSRDVVGRLWNRIKGVPEVQSISRLEHRPHITGNGPDKRNEIWLATRPNERMRFLKYVGGEYFRPHCDGTYETPDGSERSYMTIHLYLNDTGMPDEAALAKLSPAERLQAIEAGLKGGATTFHYYNEKQRVDVEPRAGRVLLFQHKNLLHSGDDVVQGVKYTMRTDLMYRLETEEEQSSRSLQQKLMSRLGKK
jgi:hypothetical protein